MTEHNARSHTLEELNQIVAQFNISTTEFFTSRAVSPADAASVMSVSLGKLLPLAFAPHELERALEAALESVRAGVCASQSPADGQPSH